MQIKLGLYFDTFDNNSLQDKRFLQLMKLVSDQNNLSKYIYAIYSDTNILSQNVFIPVFDSIYLGCSTNHIVLENINDEWLLSAYPQNKYYMLVDDSRLPILNDKIQKITSLMEIV